MNMQEWLEPNGYWFARFLFYRGLFFTFFIAFLVAIHQFIPLAGEQGILPFTRVLKRRSFTEQPSILHFFPSDTAVRVISWIGLLLSLVGLAGVEWLGPYAVGGALLVLWALYLSLVKAGGLFYGYGWESLLCETGILAAFLGGAHQEVPVWFLFLFAWLLFRVMFGAGMIKIRGDDCWRELTCMDYHYETQPMPNPLGWFAHHMPTWWHKLEVLGNHFVELIVPVFFFFPQPVSGVTGVMTILFMGWLMLTGNFSWLNFLTAIIAVLMVPDSFFVGASAYLPESLVALHPVHRYLMYAFAVMVIVLSYWPLKNLFSEDQLMNVGFDPLNLVNSYGAFGSVTKTRYELVVEGRNEGEAWRAYEFKGKPTDPFRCPPQWAPYHLRLDWQLWFAAMPTRPARWLPGLVEKLKENNPRFMRLLHRNPFEETEGPDEIRIRLFAYEYTEPEELWEEGRWWNREFLKQVYPRSVGGRGLLDQLM